MTRLQILLLAGAILFLPAYATGLLTGPAAIFQTNGGEWVNTDSNDFYNGTYLAQYGYSVSIQNIKDASHTVLGNITYSLDMDNIMTYDTGFATRSGSKVSWVFPANVTLAENTYILSSAKSDYIYPRHMPMIVHRRVNTSTFSSDGDQLVTVSLAFDNLSIADANLTLNGVWGEFATTENSDFNATLLPDTFRTDLPIINNSMGHKTCHVYEFATSAVSLEPPVTAGTVYNVSIVVHIRKKNAKTITYYPKFMTALNGGLYYQNTTLTRYAKTPSFILPYHVRSATGSENISSQWHYSFNFLRGVRMNESISSGTSIPPTVAGITPASGKRGALAVVTNLSGTNFKTGAKVFFNKTGSTTLVATNVTVLSTKKIKCTVKIPVGAVIGTWDVMVKNTDGKSGKKVGIFTVKTVTPPTVTGITPASGKRGKLLKITNLSGTGFVASPKPTVRFVKSTTTITATNVTVVSAKKITCTVKFPANAATGAWNVRVTNADSQAGAKAGAFTVTI